MPFGHKLQAPQQPAARGGSHSIERDHAQASRESAGLGTASDPEAATGDAKLRLAIGREGLGLELANRTSLGPVDIAALATTVEGLKFPLDVSGGVARFRHRRGRLVRLEIEVRAPNLAAWCAPKLRGLLGPRTPAVWCSARRGGATVSITDPEADLEGGTESPRKSPCLAFEIALEVSRDDVRCTVHGARGMDLPGPATALAIAAVASALSSLGSSAVREGASFVMRGVAGTIARRVMPDAGVRAPSCENTAWTSVAAHGDAWILHATQGLVLAAPEEEAVRAREVAALARAADDARLAGDLEQARALDLQALEQAPRHRELARRVAEIDLAVGGRAEAARAMLEETSSAAWARDGVLAGELALEAGDRHAAAAAFTRAGEVEDTPALASRALERAATLANDATEALEGLDAALARAPAYTRARWARVLRRLQAGRLEGALADVEHLEAQARGARAKHHVWRRAGEAWRRAGAQADAAILFERALRFVPDEPSSLAGLGAALVAEGRAARGVALLTRALELAEAEGSPLAGPSIELARALAERLDDPPSAIARVRAVPQSDPLALEARALEGRWRAHLGDLAGASFAFARARDAAENAGVHPETNDLSGQTEVVWLLEAAAFERDVRGDLLAAQRHLASALKVAPRHGGAREAYRAVGARLAGSPAENATPPALHAPRAPDEDRELHAPDGDREPEPNDARAIALAALREVDTPVGDGDDEARVAELTRKLQLDPTDDPTADALTLLLTKLGRSHELLALLIARLEDAAPERREVLRAPARRVLETLADDAERQGRADEASLFRDTIGMLAL